MSQTPSTNPATTPAGASGDPFAGLHKMSTTAGLGSGEYAAVNATAVAAILLGLLSILALILFEPVLLVIPLAGVVTAIVALVKIKDSNGTQTGRGLAWGGLALSLLFSLLVGGRHVQQFLDHRSERENVGQLLGKLESTLMGEKFEEAYQLFSDRFTQRVSIDEFKLRWGQMREAQYYGAIEDIVWNQRLQIIPDPTTKIRYARVLVDFDLSRSENPFRQEIILRKTDDGWRIEDIPAIFPTPQEPPPMP